MANSLDTTAHDFIKGWEIFGGVFIYGKDLSVGMVVVSRFRRIDLQRRDRGRRDRGRSERSGRMRRKGGRRKGRRRRGRSGAGGIRGGN